MMPGVVYVPGTFQLTRASCFQIFINIFITALYECIIYSNYNIATGHTTMQK